MISYSIPSANYRYAFPTNAENDHIDIDVVHYPSKGRYEATLNLLPRTIGIGQPSKEKLSHAFLRVWITAPPGIILGNKCTPRESGFKKVWFDIQGRTACWLVRRVHHKHDRSFSVTFKLDGAKNVRLEFGLHSDELKVPVTLQFDLEGAAVAPSQSAKPRPKPAVSKPKSAGGEMAAEAGA